MIALITILIIIFFVFCVWKICSENRDLPAVLRLRRRIGKSIGNWRAS